MANNPKLEGLVLYKYVTKSDFSAQLCRGVLRLGTLHGYKACEDALRGDKAEGEMLFTELTETVNGSPNSYDKQVYKALGIGFSNVENCVIGIPERYTYSPDCWICCTATQPLGEKEKAEFGHHCVKIDAKLFLLGIIDGIKKQFPNVDINYGLVTYKDRVASPKEILSLRPAFIKPSDPFGDQFEFRFMISKVNGGMQDDIPTENSAYKPIFIYSKFIKKACVIIS